MKAIFFNIPAQGHINPTLALVAELVKRGEQVIYYNTEAWRNLIEPTGATFRPYPNIPELTLLGDPPPGAGFVGNAPSLLRVGEQLIPTLLEAVRQENPDYIVHDSIAGWGKQVAQRADLPGIASITTLIFGRPGAVPPINARAAIEIVADFVHYYSVYPQTARRLWRTYGVKSQSLTAIMMNTGNLNIVYTSAIFQPEAEKFGSSYKFVGPSIMPRSEKVDFPFDQLTQHPLVYISLGTINSGNIHFYQQCFEAFAGYPGQFVLSAGKKTDIGALGPIPSNFIVRHFVPQLDLLPRVDLFINHAGINSVQEALWYDIPQIVVPQKADQAAVALQIVKHGAGVALGTSVPFGRVTVAELRASLEKLLPGGVVDKHFHTAAANLGASLRAAGGFMRAADEITAFTRKPAL